MFISIMLSAEPMYLQDDKGTLVYKATPKAKECLRAKMVERGYYLVQDDIDCFDNEVR